jgi:hypothetical protein
VVTIKGINVKLGIFGDSFANCNSDNPDVHLQWYKYVQQQMPDLEIYNHGHAGSSFYFTWKQFQEHHAKYDKVIVCGTTPNRLWMPHLPKEWELEHVHAMRMFTYIHYPPSKDIDMMKDALSMYFEYIVNDQETIDVHKLQLDNIKSLRYDQLYIPGYMKIYPDDYLPLIHISNLDGKRPKGRDTRANHLNDTNNRILADKIVKWLSTNEFNMEITEFSNK